MRIELSAEEVAQLGRTLRQAPVKTKEHRAAYNVIILNTLAAKILDADGLPVAPLEDISVRAPTEDKEKFNDDESSSEDSPLGLQHDLVEETDEIVRLLPADKSVCVNQERKELQPSHSISTLGGFQSTSSSGFTFSFFRNQSNISFSPVSPLTPLQGDFEPSPYSNKSIQFSPDPFLGTSSSVSLTRGFDESCLPEEC